MVRIGIDEDVAVIEGRDEADHGRKQHAVAEHIARHVPDPGHGEPLGLNITTHLAEVPLHGDPRAPRGDAHRLVIVARGAARGESVVQPEAALLRDGVGGVGEGRRALVGRDHEIGIVPIEPRHVRRRHDLAVHDVVRHRQQRADEGDVGRPARLEPCVAIRAGRQVARKEATLGADRHDDRVLDLLRLDEAQDFRAVILRPIRPAQAAPRHGTEAQVHAFHLRTVNEDLREGARLGQTIQGLGVQLDGDVVGVGRTFGVLVPLPHQLLQRVGPPRGENGVVHPPEDAILIETLDTFQRFLDLGALRVAHAVLAFVLRIVPCENGIEQEFGDSSVPHQGAGDQLLRERDAGLLQVA